MILTNAIRDTVQFVGQNGIRAIAPEENCLQGRVRVWVIRVRVRVSFRVGGQFSSGAIVP